MSKELRKLIREEIQNVLKEEDIIPTGPDGQKISDPKVIKNLNLALKAVSGAVRPKIIQMIQDPGAAKELRNPAQKAAVIGAIAIAFGISEKEFSQIVAKIKAILPKPGEEIPGEEPAKP